MYRFLLISTFLVVTGTAFGQTHQIDSLKHSIYIARNDKDKLQAILNLCDNYETIPKDTLWYYALKAKVLASSINDGPKRTIAICGQAQAYLRWGNTDSARALIEPEILKYKIEDAGTRDLYFKLAQLKVDCIGNSDNYKGAIAEVYNVMRQAEMYKDSVVIAESMNTLCAFNYDMNFLDKSRSWAYKGLSYTTNAPKFTRAIIGLCLNLGGNYWWIGKQDSATYYIDKAIDLSSRIQNLYFLTIAYERKAGIYTRLKNYTQAESTLLLGMQTIRKVDGNAPQQDILIALSAIYRNSGKIDKAIKVLSDGMVADSLYHQTSPHAKQDTTTPGLQKVFYYQELARCYRLKGDSKNYETCLEKIIEGKDAFYTANSAQAIAELETKYETKKKEATIAQQRLALIKENYFLYGSILVILLASTIAWLIFKDYRRKQKLRMQLLQDEEKRLSAQAVAFAQEKERKRIAADLHDNLGAQLSFIKRNVNFIMDQPAGFSQDDERKYLNNVNDIAQNAMIDLRETIWVLNKDDVSIQEFADKLKSYLKQQLMGKEDIEWDFKEEIAENWKLSSGEVMHIFRIVQEVISNVIKHAGASRVGINLASNSPGIYRLEIFDNGKGFDTISKYDGHYGLENIQQRAKEIFSTISVQSGPKTGTRIILVKDQNNTNELLGNQANVITFIK